MAAELQARIVLPSARADAMTNPLILKFEQRDRLSDEEKRLLEGMPTLTNTKSR